MIKLIILIVIAASVVVDRIRPGENSQEPVLPASFDEGYHSIWMYHAAVNPQSAEGLKNIDQVLVLFERYNIPVVEVKATIHGDCRGDHCKATGFLVQISSKDYEKAKKLGWIYREDMATYNQYPPPYVPPF